MGNRNDSPRVTTNPPGRRRPCSNRPRGIFLTLVIGALLITTTASAGQPASARQVKAAFILNFLQFVEWPGTRSTAPAIGVLGDDDLTAALSEASRRTTSGGAEVTIRRLTRIEDASGVQILVIGTSEQSRLPAILRGIEGLPVLTVGDTLGFAKAGVMLNLYTFDQRVRIEINTAAAARAQLKLSSHLLRLARIVE